MMMMMCLGVANGDDAGRGGWLEVDRSWRELTCAMGGMANFSDKPGTDSESSSCSFSRKGSCCWYAGRLYWATRVSILDVWLIDQLVL